MSSHIYDARTSISHPPPKKEKSRERNCERNRNKISIFSTYIPTYIGTSHKKTMCKTNVILNIRSSGRFYLDQGGGPALQPEKVWANRTDSTAANDSISAINNASRRRRFCSPLMSVDPPPATAQTVCSCPRSASSRPCRPTLTCIRVVVSAPSFPPPAVSLGASPESVLVRSISTSAAAAFSSRSVAGIERSKGAAGGRLARTTTRSLEAGLFRGSLSADV